MLAKGHKDSSLEILIPNTTVMVRLIHPVDEGGLQIHNLP